MEDWHNFGVDYDPTLMAWMANVDAHKQELAQAGYGDDFYRMWRFFLLSSAGAFRARRNHLWQIVYSKCGLDRGYAPVR
jgi:cyclopropane-fatty-acyl-phospholipid synthase